MGARDFLEEAGPSSFNEKFSNGSFRMDIDDDMDFDYSDSDDELDGSLQDLDEGFLKSFCKKASTAFFDQYGLISHQINSYNDFVRNGIQKVFDSIGEIVIEPGYDPSKNQILDWIKVETHLEVFTESLSRSDKFKTGVDKFIEKTLLHEYHTDVNFGRLPVMVKSDLCWMSELEEKDCEFEQGGYFVIKGAEKTFIAQEQICLKRLWVAKSPTWTISYRPVSKRKRIFVKLVPKVEHITGGEKILTVYFYVTEIPIWLLFFALGVPNDREAVKMIDLDVEDSAISNILIASIYDADRKYEGFRKGGNAQKYIKELMQGCRFPPTESVEECITNYLFPHLKSPEQKACFLAYMVKCLLEAYRGRRKVDNRDDLRNKRLELAGELLERELKVHIKHAERRMVKSIQRDLYKDREVQSIDHYLDASIITNGLSRAFSTGAWSHPYKRMERISGIVATIRRTNPLQATADMRKTRQQVSYTGRVGDARYPHPSHWGKICFLSTPDGENCGLVKNLASMGLVSTDILNRESLLQRFYECGMEMLVDDASTLLNGKHKIFLDEIGLESIEIKRDKHHGEVRIFADAGRILRPLLIVQNLKKIKDLKGDFSFQSLLDSGIIELIGPEEEEDCQTAWGRPLFRTVLSDCLGRSKYDHHKGMLPRPEFFNGQCAIVAVNVHLGYNQEDSLVMNRASLERGMFRSEHIRSYKAEVENSEAAGKKPKTDDLVSFGKMQSKIGRVDSLDDDGFPYIGANLQTGDIVIGKHAASGVDHSIKLKHTEKGMVQKVVLSANDEGKNFAVVSLRQVRSPCLGDKFSSMHGQKGVLGFLESQENFPFTKQGIVPDIVINPHAFPSRQTPGQLLEAALAKGIALGGGLKYATPFTSPSVEDITAQLHRLGFSRWGDERVYDGRTGEKVQSLIFMGPTFYQRLTHMAEDKVKFRNTGPVHPLTRQPVADRKRFGGIKFGEMERDCLIAHGAAANLHERLFTLSDSSQMHICRKCKNMANVIQRPVFGGRKIRGPYCRFCESVEDVVRVNVPYGAKLLCQELFSMGISLKFDTELC
ncbi:UNVERIFIED_CONTAM: DNA-directed RNA polymerases IV and V subunit [Sesamum radiatum]|uniref:DNA-directed RNA polymerase subunit beta n=1 Tax=Sesamum radiatum TaxID=300843 RepID=A0AAW2JTX6_SESRA